MVSLLTKHKSPFSLTEQHQCDKSIIAMEQHCDLQVDVNGEEIFFVNKKILSSFLGKMRRLFGKLDGSTTKLKVIFHDFPGGADGFELIVRFCYDKGRTKMNPADIVLLKCAANYMEMNMEDFGTTDLKDLLEAEFLDSVSCWTCSELLVALKQYQYLLPAAGSVCIIILPRLLDSLVEKLALTCVSSPYATSSDSSNFRFSCDTRNTATLKMSCSRTTWWFEDLVFLNIDLIEKVVETMVSNKFNHARICKFLFYYQKSRFKVATTAHEKRKVAEIIINLLCLLERSCISCKGLFEILRVALTLKISKCFKNKLESLIGWQLDQATLDDLLLPSLHGKDYIYDVGLVLRLLKLFLLKGSCSLARLRKVSGLIDLYAMEVAPDLYLKPSKFAALVMALPDYARNCHDGIYQAINMYLEVHGGLSEEEKTRLCCAINCEKLSQEVLKHLARNSKFPSKTSMEALISRDSKLKSLLFMDTHLVKSFSEFPFCCIEKENTGKEEDGEKILHSKNIYFPTENEKAKGHLQGMQSKAMELEKLCKKLQTQMGNIMKSRRVASSSNAKFLPKLCS